MSNTTTYPDKEFMCQKAITFCSHVDFHDVYSTNEFRIINVIDHDYERNLVIHELVEEIQKIITGETIYEIEVIQSTADKFKYQITCSSNINKLLQMVASIRTVGFLFSFHQTKLNPMLWLFHSCFGNVLYRERFENKYTYSYQEGQAYLELDRALERMLETANTTMFQQELDGFMQQVEHNTKKLTKQLQALYTAFDELEVVRLDLFYRPDVAQHDTVTALAHRKLFVDYAGRYYRNIQGAIVKTEYTAEKGFHHHVALFLIPNDAVSSLEIGHDLGSYWSQEITHATGTYFNGAQVPGMLRSKPVGLVKTNSQEATEQVATLIDWVNKLDQYYRPMDPTKDTSWHWNRFNV